MLSNFSDAELRAELKRRAILKRTENRKPTEYISLTGVVSKINNIERQYRGMVKYKPYGRWTYQVSNLECDDVRVLNWCFHILDFKCALTKAKSPQVGDKVCIRIRKIKNLSAFSVRNSKIVQIIA
jgi:hypothetical protein